MLPNGPARGNVNHCAARCASPSDPDRNLRPAPRLSELLAGRRDGRELPNETEEVSIPMYFTIERASGGYRAHIYGGNHELVFWTEVYVNKAGARNAIDMVKRGAPGAPIYDRA